MCERAIATLAVAALLSGCGSGEGGHRSVGAGGTASNAGSSSIADASANTSGTTGVGGETGDAATDAGGDAVEGGEAGAEDAREVTCTDHSLNGTETDVDCGGACAPCDTGKHCDQGRDCASLVCTNGVCSQPSCDDKTKNGGETDVDCGRACAIPCEVGSACDVGEDCSSSVCQAGSCRGPECADGTMNGEELDTDCGGACGPCAAGQRCTTAQDCSSGVCTEEVCQDPSCTDLVLNGTESDVDCGGSCERCFTGQTCSSGNDCAGGVCSGDVCVSATCSDGVSNGFETAIDCGGSECGPCADGDDCVEPSDCISGKCGPTGCLAASCSDGLLNGSETDIDCGGICGGCSTSGSCVSPDDCMSRVCVNGACQAPSCSDGVTNGAETDVDCGVACRPCELAGVCTTAAGCASGECFFGRCASPDFDLLAPRIYESGVGKLEFGLGDVTGDGLVDIVGLNADGTFAVLENQGQARFARVQTGTLQPSGQKPKYRALVEDFDGDGDLDVATVSDGPGTEDSVTLLENQSGTLVSAASHREFHYTEIAYGDITGDGIGDIIASHQYDGMYLLRGRPGALPDAPEKFHDGNAVRVIVHDFNLDGLGDILYSDQGYEATFGAGDPIIIMNQGSLQFGPKDTTNWNGAPHSLADFDGDGILELVTTERKIIRQDGLGNFEVWKQCPDLTPGCDWSPTNSDAEFAVGDMNNDGLADVVDLVQQTSAKGDPPRIQLRINEGGGQLTTWSEAVAPYSSRRPQLADLDADGFLDVVITAPGTIDLGGANLQVMKNDGNGRLIAPVPLSVQIDGLHDFKSWRVTHCDLDNDGDEDVVWSGYAPGNSSMPGGHTWARTAFLEQGQVVAAPQVAVKGKEPRGIVCADFNGDGLKDIAMAHFAGASVVYQRAHGYFDQTIDIVDSAGAMTLVALDLNGDDQADLVVGRQGKVSTYLSKPNGQFSRDADYTAPGVTEHLALGDLDKDGILDVVATDFGKPLSFQPGNVTAFLTKGGRLTNPRTFQTGGYPSSTAVGDVDGDGELEIVVADEGANEAVIVHRSASGYSITSRWPVLVHPRAIDLADVKMDGRLDIALAVEYSDGVSVLLNTGSGKFQRRQDYAAGHGPLGVTMLDVDESGTPDVVALSDAGLSMMLNVATATALLQCAPNKPLCVDGVRAMCNASGSSALLGVRCGSGESCIGGVCHPNQCDPGQYSCNGGKLSECNEDGAGSRVIDVCEADEYCSPASFECLPDRCKADAPYCLNGYAHTCKADGSGPVDDGFKCPTWCFEGSCVGSVLQCVPGEARCTGKKIYHCSDAGDEWDTVESCYSEYQCYPGEDDCRAPTCAPGSSWCEADVVRYCNDESSGRVESPFLDCRRNGDVCVGGACQAVEVYDLPESPPSRPLDTRVAYQQAGLGFRMDTSRRLVEYEYRFRVDEAGEVTWVIYRSAHLNAAAEQVWSTTSAVAPTASAQYHSSGPVNIVLSDGYYYSLSYFVSVPSKQSGRNLTLSNIADAEDQPSFGQALGGLRGRFLSIPTTTLVGGDRFGVPTSRVTTVAP